MLFYEFFLDHENTPLHPGPDILGGEKHPETEIFGHGGPLLREKGGVKLAHFDSEDLFRWIHTSNFG